MEKVTKKIFGIPIALFVVGLLVIGGASAALVGYISNKVQADVAVTSPMEQGIKKLWTDTYSTNTISFTGFGGETKTFYIKTENVADVSITGEGKNIISSPGITCADFTEVKAKTTNDGGSTWDGYYPILGVCVQVNPYTVSFDYGPVGGTTWSAGQIDETEIVVTFKPNALGTYTFTSQVVPV